ISKGLVELMGGAMWVESDEGKGSTFHFTLRLPACTSAVGVLQQAQPDLAGLRVLVAEGNATLRFVLPEAARSWGLIPVEATTPQHALDQVRAGATLDLAIIDFNLAGMNGLQLAAELRKSPSLEQLPVVFLTTVSPDQRHAPIDCLRA